MQNPRGERRSYAPSSAVHVDSYVSPSSLSTATALSAGWPSGHMRLLESRLALKNPLRKTTLSSRSPRRAKWLRTRCSPALTRVRTGTSGWPAASMTQRAHRTRAGSRSPLSVIFGKDLTPSGMTASTVRITLCRRESGSISAIARRAWTAAQFATRLASGLSLAGTKSSAAGGTNVSAQSTRRASGPASAPLALRTAFAATAAPPKSTPHSSTSPATPSATTLSTASCSLASRLMPTQLIASRGSSAPTTRCARLNPLDG
mmetsp:Transcript_6887/g.28151  ORF Transcript_6887/g.28151 Transcript_6887/m.28151 type:complete len:261 (-) Transcript_6887:1015-1797(-)